MIVVVTLVVRKNTPLSPLAKRARELSKQSDALWVATAFASDAAVSDVVGSAAVRGATVRFLTGTFGRVTRLRTFKRLSRLGQTNDVQTRIWDGDFHVKLLLWRRGRRGIAWVGSANLTDRGLQNEGELMIELTGSWSDARFRALRRGFEEEWHEAQPLDEAFLRRYREAPRVGHLLRSAGVRAPRGRMAARGRAMLVVTVGHHYSDGSPTVERVDECLGGTADAWYRSPDSDLRLVQRGSYCMLVDVVAATVSVVVATDCVRDQKAWVFSYERFTRLADRTLGKRLRHILSDLGLTPAKRDSGRSGWIEKPPRRSLSASTGDASASALKSRCETTNVDRGFPGYRSSSFNRGPLHQGALVEARDGCGSADVDCQAPHRFVLRPQSTRQ